MQQATLTSYFKTTKKRPLQSPEEKVKLKQAAVESNRVQFVKKGNLSPVKVSPVKTQAQNQSEIARLKAVARNFKESQAKLEKLRQKRRQFEEESTKLIQKQPESPRKKLFLEAQAQLQKKDEEKEKSVAGEKSVASPISRSEGKPETTATSIPSSISDAAASSQLTLPFRFQVLKMLNDSMNNIASMFQRRSEVLTFKKLKPAVESTTNHTFSLKSVARMLSITDHFQVQVQKIDKTNQYVFEFQIDLLPSQLVRLKKNFHAKLMEFCLLEHDKFLKSQNIEVDPSRVTRWHPSFQIELLQIPATKLPELEEKLSSVSEVLNQVREMVNVSTAKTTAAAAALTLASKTSSQPAQKKPVSIKELKGISASLLQKVRDREKNRIVRDLTVPPEQLELKRIKSRLPELTRIIHNIFIGEKRAAIELPLFLERLQFSYGKLSTSETESHLDYLLKNYPAWIQKIKSTTNDYIKINKQVNISDLTF